jgi:hypothetical protein
LPRCAAPQAIVEALASLRYTPARPALVECLRHDDKQVRSAALMALIRLGDEGVLHPHYLTAQKEAWPRECLALAGDESAATVFERLLADGRADADVVLWLGLLGQGSSLQSLYDAMKQPELADAAALALHWMTGADLYEDVFVEAEFSEEEMTDVELKAWKEKGQAPRRDDGTPFGETVRKLSTDTEVWKQWFAGNAQRFEDGRRYRAGEVWTPGVLLAQIEAERSDYRLRAFCAKELVVRCGCPVELDVDAPVDWQICLLRYTNAWVSHVQPAACGIGDHVQGA